ncbi:hypothetical protein AB0G79_15665 [Streptomyces sp. NPDC020807]
MPVDPYAVLQALLRAEAARARRVNDAEREPQKAAAPAEPPVHREDPVR